MRNKQNRPNARQKQWMAEVASLGSIVSGGPCQIHHAVGSSAQAHVGAARVDIGHEWILPLTEEEHRLIHGSNEDRLILRNRWVTKGHYVEGHDRKELEKAMFRRVRQQAAIRRFRLPEPEVIEAILEWHR